MTKLTKDRIRAAVFGAAVGDAVGVPYEFSLRAERKRSPAVDMIGHGTYYQPAGTWSDDTSMILCTLDHLDPAMNEHAIMQAFCAWMRKGDYSPHQECFDIGGTTGRALRAYERSGDPSACGQEGERSNGNGSLMRIIPAALYACAHGLSTEEAVRLSHRLSCLTHANLRCQMGCGIFTCVALALLARPDKASVREGLRTAAAFYAAPAYEKELPHYRRVLSEGFFDLPEAEISGAGYVVATLESALWCLMQTDDYRACVLQAVNLGEDTDTTACVAGALAGLLYGYEGIPADWRRRLTAPDRIDDVTAHFAAANGVTELLHN